MPAWIHVSKEALKFSAAHFLIFPDGSAERLHGHNYRVRVGLRAEIGPDDLALDFGVLKRELRSLVGELDERFIVPSAHPEVHVRAKDGMTSVRYRAKFYLAPSDEVLPLPIVNSSSEAFARYLCEELMTRLELVTGADRFHELRVAVEETSGQEAEVSLPFPIRANSRPNRRRRDVGAVSTH